MWKLRGWQNVKKRYSIFKKKEKNLPFINLLVSEPKIPEEAVEAKQPQVNKLVELYYNVISLVAFFVLIVIPLAIEAAIVWTGTSVISGEWAFNKNFGEYLLGFFLGNVLAVIISILSYVGGNWLFKKIIKLIVSRRIPAGI